jgi:hypothetical protein
MDGENVIDFSTTITIFKELEIASDNFFCFNC